MTIRAFQQYSPTIATSAYVDETALVIGQVSLAEEVSIWPMCVLRGDVNTITIGKGSNIQDGSIIHGTHAGPYNPDGYDVKLGESVVVGHQAVLHGCHIEDRVLIGIGSKIMDGALIETEVMLGANSFVPPNKILQSGFLYFGSPAKQIRPLTPQEKSYLQYNANYYLELKEKYR